MADDNVIPEQSVAIIERDADCNVRPVTAPGYGAIRRHGFADVLREQRRSRPDQLAAVDFELRLTWRELDDRVNCLSNALISHGVGVGDRLLWLGQNSVKLFELLLAAAKIGAFMVPANWRMAASEIREIIDDLDPRVIFWQEAELRATHIEARTAGRGERIWCQHDGKGPDCFDALLANGAPIDHDWDVDPEQPLLGVYTAAFSGKPAAAMLSHTALLLQAILSSQSQAIDEKTRYLVSGPMFHIGVLMGAFGTYVRGGRQIFVPRINALELMYLIDREKVTHAYIPQPTVVQIRETHPTRNYDLSSLFKNGDPAEWRATLVVPPHAPIAQSFGGYGQTECSGYLTQSWLGGSGAGLPHPLAQLRIVGDDGKDRPAGEIGEIVARGPMVMCGYFNRPAENAARTGFGWHRTGDLGIRRLDGSVVFVGPKTTMIKSGVENIYPVEVEACLLKHPAVAAICVIGVPDAMWDQNVKALVVFKEGMTATVEELTAHCKQEMASYKKPKLWEFVPELPRLQSGGIDREAADKTFGGGGYPSRGVTKS
jgi:acyl-CoA synthetase (AMP-forming)/AMP-acid ligase II